MATLRVNIIRPTEVDCTVPLPLDAIRCDQIGRPAEEWHARGAATPCGRDREAWNQPRMGIDRPCA